jgi:hypothetical protein
VVNHLLTRCQGKVKVILRHPTYDSSRQRCRETKSPPELIQAFESVMPGPPEVARQMFGYPAGFVNDNMFMGLFPESMIPRLAEPSQGQLLKLDGAQIFEPMQGRPVKEYVAVPPAVIASSGPLYRDLHKCAADFTGSW